MYKFRGYRDAFMALLIAMTFQPLYSQNHQKIHSHNDYRQLVPFYQAYSQRVSSIETDIFHQDGLLLVGHDLEELNRAYTLKRLYIKPIAEQFIKNGGKAWPDSDENLILMIDIKSSTEPALNTLITLLNEYQHVFDPTLNPNAVRVIVTGNVPEPEDFEKYPPIVCFDGTVDRFYTEYQLKRVAIISVPFYNYAHWNGKGSMKKAEKIKVREAIEKAHKINKPIRFWASPDGVTAWNTLYQMGVDFINTDRVERCADFFKNISDMNYSIHKEKQEVSSIRRTDKLDKITSGFNGFDSGNIQLTEPIPLYSPSHLNDGVNSRLKNVILLIGDGMGMNHISVAQAVNKGLTMLNMKYTGFQLNSPLDSYTSDSAAGGSAIATGKPHNNRHISMNEDGTENFSITDYAFEKGIATGVVTLGNIADATPAAFYGHSTERDSSDLITRYLLKKKLNLLVGGGTTVFTDRRDGLNINDFKKDYEVVHDVQQIKNIADPLLCVDNLMEQAATQETIGLLADVTGSAIEKLIKESKKGFFLMVEGAKIDYAGHSNSLAGTVSEMLSFDLAVAEALKFADTNGETLVIVTSDHETGGLVLIDGDQEKGLITARFTTDDHTPAMLPLYAYGPGAQFFTGTYWNYDIANKIIELLQLK